MQNLFLRGLALDPSVSQIIRRLNNQRSDIFGEYNEADYQNLVDVFARLSRDAHAGLLEDFEDQLREFVDYGIIAIARRYEYGQAIHPGIMNILIMAIQVYNQVYGHPYQFDVDLIPGITPPTEDFMIEVVQPMTRTLQLLALHHAEWVNPGFVAQVAARRMREEAPGAETHIARTVAEFRAMGGDAMEPNCPICMEAFIERPEDAMKSKLKRTSPRHPVFLPIVFHKDEKGKWFHPMHTVCVNDVKKDECPMCRVKVLWPKMMLIRKTRRRPNSEPTPGRRSTRRSPGRRSTRRSPGRRSTKRSALHRASAEF